MFQLFFLSHGHGSQQTHPSNAPPVILIGYSKFVADQHTWLGWFIMRIHPSRTDREGIFVEYLCDTVCFVDSMLQTFVNCASSLALARTAQVRVHASAGAEGGGRVWTITYSN